MLIVVAEVSAAAPYLVPILDHERLNRQVFPRAYFAWCAQNENSAALPTAYVRGTALRNRLLTLAAFRQTPRLLPILRSSGTKMRRFHDAFASIESIDIGLLIDSTADLVRETTFFSAAEKASVRSHLDRYAQNLSVRTPPKVHLHNDWILRTSSSPRKAPTMSSTVTRCARGAICAGST
jgi:hypothetical protein